MNCFGRVFRNLFTMKNSDGPTKDGVAHFSTVLHFRLGEGGDPSLKPFLVGCHDELGQWDLSKAIPLKPGPGVGRWEGTVSFPRAESTLFFKYVLLFTNADGVPDPNRLGDAIWEDGHNRELHVAASGQAELGGTALPHHFRHFINANPPCAEVTFTVHHARRGQEMVLLVGDTPNLGDWDPHHSVALEAGATDKLGRTRWSTKLSLPLNASLEFKYILVNASEPEAMTWEGGMNRLCSVHYGGGVTFFPDELGLEMDGASEGERPLLSVPASALTVAARARAAGIGGGGRFLFREFRSLTSGVRTRVKSMLRSISQGLLVARGGPVSEAAAPDKGGEKPGDLSM